MGAIRITQLDGKLPNLALMKLAAWHRAQGDEIHFFRGAKTLTNEPRYSRVYGSAIFKFSEPLIDEFKAAFPDAILGGTGTGEKRTVEDVIGGSFESYDYSVAPEFTASIGFTERGCRMKCKFCVVPEKEGKPVHNSDVWRIWRGPGFPKHLHLLDNDFFGGPNWRENITAIRDGGFKVSFTQGINTRLVTDEVAAAIASVEYRDDSFSRRTLYTAWDNLKDESVFFRGVETLARAGIPPKRLMAYMLVGFDKNETWPRIWHRFNRMVDIGIRPYPMVYDRSRLDLLAFQRWVVTGLYRATPFYHYRSPRVTEESAVAYLLS